MDVSPYLAWRYHLTRCNCWHMVRAAWLDLTGRDLGERTPAQISFDALVGRFDTDVPAFHKLAGPQEPSIVLMRSPGAVPHVGVYHRRRVLQMTKQGASFMPLEAATRGYMSVEHYSDESRNRQQPV